MRTDGLKATLENLLREEIPGFKVLDLGISNFFHVAIGLENFVVRDGRIFSAKTGELVSWACRGCGGDYEEIPENMVCCRCGAVLMEC